MFGLLLGLPHGHRSLFTAAVCSQQQSVNSRSLFTAAVWSQQQSGHSSSLVTAAVWSQQQSGHSSSLVTTGVRSQQESVHSRSLCTAAVWSQQESVHSRSLVTTGICSQQESVHSSSPFTKGVCSQQESGHNRSSFTAGIPSAVVVQCQSHSVRFNAPHPFPAQHPRPQAPHHCATLRCPFPFFPNLRSPNRLPFAPSMVASAYTPRALPPSISAPSPFCSFYPLPPSSCHSQATFTTRGLAARMAATRSFRDSSRARNCSPASTKSDGSTR